MSIQSIFVNFILKKYIKQKKSSVEQSSYLDARKMMNQKGYEEETDSVLSEWLTKKIFGSKDFDISIEEIDGLSTTVIIKAFPSRPTCMSSNCSVAKRAFVISTIFLLSILSPTEIGIVLKILPVETL